MATSLKAQKLEKTNGGKDSQKSAVAQQLFTIVCDSYVLFGKTQGYHWNVSGPQFYSLHKLFEEQYNELFAAIDELAERVRALNAAAPLSIHEMVKNSSIQDVGKKVPSASDMVSDLLKNNEYLAKAIRDAIKVCEDAHDDATADLLTGRLEAHDKAAWMLRSSL